MTIRVLFAVGFGLAVASSAMAQVTAAPTPGDTAAQMAPSAASASIYSVTVPVAGTSDAQRSAAIAAALTLVLQQVAPGFAVPQEVLAGASGYVRDLRYQRAAAGTGLQLQVDFDPGAIERIVAARPAGGNTTGAPTSAPGASTPAAGGSAATAATVTHGTAYLWVAGIPDGHAFAGLLALLRGDPALQQVIPVAAAGDGVLLQVGFNQPLAEVIAALDVPGGHLATAASEHPGADVSLRWQP